MNNLSPRCVCPGAPFLQWNGAEFECGDCDRKWVLVEGGS